MKLFLKPMAFWEALKALRERRLVPTSLSTRELREIDANVRRQALFSARLTQLRPLQTLLEGVTSMLEGTANLADAKLELQKVYAEMGYDAEAGGFKQDQPGTVPPARRGSLRDLASDRRMALSITTNYRIAANQAFVARGMQERRLRQWPAWELVRIGRVRIPRGFKAGRGGVLEPVPQDGWEARWTAAGGEIFEGRMIALKTSPVWQRLGDGAGGYTDTLGNPFAPFAFGSKYGVREVARQEALLLGVISPDAPAQEVPGQAVPKVQTKAEAAGIDPALIAAMKRDLARAEDGSVRLRRAVEADLVKAGEAYRNRLQVVCDLMNGKRKGPARRHRSFSTSREFHEDEWVRSGGRFAAYHGPQRVDSVKDLLAKLKDHPKDDYRAHIMMLDGRVGARMSKAFGRDVRGYELILDARDYRHAMANHADEVGDKWMSIPAIISRAEHIIPSAELTAGGERAVEVWKADGSWLKLVLAESRDRKVKIKTFKRRKELFNRLFGKGSWMASAAPMTGGGALTSETTQVANKMRGECCQRPQPHAQSVSDLRLHATPLHGRCKALLSLLEGRAA